MIYLIDENKGRQVELGWDQDKFSKYLSHIKPLYNIEEVSKVGDGLYETGNIILYHESFLDFTQLKEKAADQRDKLRKRAEGTQHLYVAFFSGSQNSRFLEKNIAQLPVATIYQNLEILIEQFESGNPDLKYLLFGRNPDIEEKLNGLLNKANREIEENSVIISGSNLFVRPDTRYIQKAIVGAAEKTLFNNVSDEKLSERVSEWLSEKEYESIFIPLCFGQTLSDFNGLRLATHIRCTETPNQLTRIFIYSFVGIDYLLENEYFNILKTKNVHLVPYRKKGFQEFGIQPAYPFTREELSKEIAKLKIDPPKNYADNHSIANEWAIHQWAKMIGCDETQDLEKVFKNVSSNLYFKYLRTVFPILETDKINSKELEIRFEGKPKVLLIDDEAEKGWNEILACLLTDINNLYSDYLVEDFRNLSREQIVERSIKKILDDDIDVVLLDFRLNSNDHEITDPEHVTSVKLLRKIKEVNPGIQVINFSATSKIWNLQQLQLEGADGFVFKGSPEASGDQKFLNKNINSFIYLLNNSINKLFLKEFYKLIFSVEKSLLKCEYEDDSDYQGFINDLLLQVKLIGESGKVIHPKIPITIDVVFLNIYNFLEKFKNFYLFEENYKFSLGANEVELRRFRNNGNAIEDDGMFIRDSSNDNPSWYQCIVGILVDYFQVIPLEDKELINVRLVKDWRNNYIHKNKSAFSSNELLVITRLMVLITSKMKE